MTKYVVEDKMKKANIKGDIAITTIIIAAIALIVLIIIVAIFSGKINLFSKATANTTGEYRADKCKVPGSGRDCCKNLPGEIKIDGTFADCPKGCCII